ncbi:WD40-repeat-containing domain protein [Delphinella strobiligena]|nr:WD40-repeat-containing domain protein [Delphinella strobiligena]
MSGFFTKPASLKRKRTESAGAARPARRQQNVEDSNRPRKRREARSDDDDISSGSSEDEGAANIDENVGSESESEGEQNEDAAGRRTRLAERYLENTRREILAEGFDAKDIDAELLAERMGERLKEDTAESKGKIYRWISDDYDWRGASHTQFRADTLSPTGVACCPPHIYTVSKDMTLTKWELPQTNQEEHGEGEKRTSQRVKPKRVAFAKGNGKRHEDYDYKYHTGSILCVAASTDGKFVATGGEDKKLIVWDAATLKPLKVFTHHRDSVTSLAFRRTTNQLFSASKDRTIKIWSLDELAYVETLFGHQDEVVGVAALNEEKCVTVGARDRTARYWRIVEESQLVFRGGGNTNSASARRKRGDDGLLPEIKSYNEGCIDRVAMVDEETFVTGSDNGTISLWNIQKKKAVFNLPLAHGLDPPPRPEDVSAEADPEHDVSVFRDDQPRWITALVCLPFSNIVVSGSWDGQIRAWKISEDKRRLEPLGPVGCKAQTKTLFQDDPDGEENVIGALNETSQESTTVRGVVNDLAIFERGDSGQHGISIVAAIGKEHRLGRWYSLPGKNYSMLFNVSKRALTNGHTANDGE